MSVKSEKRRANELCGTFVNVVVRVVTDEGQIGEQWNKQQFDWHIRRSISVTHAL